MKGSQGERNSSKLNLFCPAGGGEPVVTFSSDALPLERTIKVQYDHSTTTSLGSEGVQGTEKFYS